MDLRASLLAIADIIKGKKLLGNGSHAAMKVLWFSHLVPYPETGLGVLQRSYHLVRELARAHEVYLLAFVQRKIITELLGDVEAGLQKAREHLGQYCARVQFLSIPSDGSRLGMAWLATRSLAGAHPYTIRWLLSANARRAAADWSATIDFDVAHFDTLSLAPYRRIFTRGAKSLDHHNIESDMMLRRARTERHPLKRFYFWQEGLRLQRYEQRVCPQFDLNITCSSLDTERLKNIAPGLMATEVPNGVDTSYFRPDGGAESPLSLVFAGNLGWYPNAAAMLFFAENVWPALKKELPQVTMDVIGARPPARLLDLAARDSNFRVHGFVPDVRPYISRAALYICPIMDGGGTKLKILDALAMGKAIVAHPIACEGIGVRDGHDVMFAREAGEFVRTVVTLLGSPQTRQRLSANARLLAESTYSYTVIGRKLVKELEQCRERYVVSSCGGGMTSTASGF
jgi:glycosyltransferase involved in cell wall biosynthesis